MAKQDASPSSANPTSIPVPKGNGFPETNVKTSGIKQRGAGAATKGKTSRGPMA